jgi:hypothetical protein
VRGIKEIGKISCDCDGDKSGDFNFARKLRRYLAGESVGCSENPPPFCDFSAS